MGMVWPTFTDYSTGCGELPQSLIQMLANSLIVYNDHVMLNTLISIGYCEDESDFWDCDNNGIDPERALVENLFALDECGRLGVKIFMNYGSGRQ